jgi:hypothetical protein
VWQDSDITGGKVRLKFSTTPGETIGASGLAPGEVAINVADAKFFCKDENGAVQSFPQHGVTTELTVGVENLVFVDGVLTAVNQV